MPELTQLESTKSTMRNLPPKGVAGLQRFSVKPRRRSPRPPAMIMARVPPVRRLTYRPEDVRETLAMRVILNMDPELQRIADGRHHDPHTVLGRHGAGI